MRSIAPKRSAPHVVPGEIDQLAGVERRQERYPIIKEKIRTILRIGALMGHDSLVLGALGCGAFCTPPAQMARLFHQVLDETEFQGRFSKLVFAITDSANTCNFKPFQAEFS